MAHAPVSERFTAQRRQLFLATLAQQGNVQKAAKAIKISSRTCYNYRKADPLFAQAWDDAIRSAMDTVLEPEAMRRAVDGVLKPVYQGGELVGHIREYSDTLLIFLLKGGKPERYRDNVRVQTDVTVHLEASLGQGLTKLAVLRSVPHVLALPSGMTERTNGSSNGVHS